MTRGRPTFRFAPSPTGELHLGHAFSALTTWRWAERLGGRFVLRIEDIDTGRVRPHFIEQIYEDLAWLGLSWETPVRQQSAHFDCYRNAASRLWNRGLLYPCFATRSEIKAAAARDANAAKDPDGAPLYPGLHKHLSSDEVEERKAAGQAFALRLDMELALRMVEATDNRGRQALTYTALDEIGTERLVEARPERWGDAVIVRKDVPTSYHLTVVVDDALQGVTHVTRGRDLEAATDLHRLLQILLGLPEPVYHHHQLIVDDDGHKLSKSDGATTLRSYREAGASRHDVLEMIGRHKSTW